MILTSGGLSIRVEFRHYVPVFERNKVSGKLNRLGERILNRQKPMIFTYVERREQPQTECQLFNPAYSRIPAVIAIARCRQKSSSMAADVFTKREGRIVSLEKALHQFTMNEQQFDEFKAEYERKIKQGKR